jgi:hypothetical protein
MLALTTQFVFPYRLAARAKADGLLLNEYPAPHAFAQALAVPGRFSILWRVELRQVERR